MNPERWHKLQQIFHAARRLDETARGVYLATECAGDTQLRREAEAMLAADAARGDALDSSATAFGVLDPHQKETIGMPILQVGARFGVRQMEDGTTSERYQVARALDTGGMGEVYLAQDLTTGNKVAVKVLRADKQGDAWTRKKFVRDEAHKIQHPNVARVLDKGRLASGEPFLVMEFVPGQTLWHRINAYKTQDRQMPLAEAAEIIRQTGRGVAALHQAHLVHRDLKPQNIIVDENPDTGEIFVKVIDFGIVRDLSHSTVLGHIAGTPYYMSPEQLRGQDVTPASDVYALGVIAYQTLTNTLPFNGDTAAQIMAAQKVSVAAALSVLRPQLPREAQAVLLEALSYDAPDRRRAAHQFGDDLAQALTAPPSAPSAEVAPPRVGPLAWLRARPGLSVACLLAIAALVVIVSWGNGRNSLITNPPPPTPTPAPTVDARPQRALTYWLTIKRQRDGKTIPATGREVFDTGDEFFFNFAPAQTGALYVFNEGRSGKWHVLAPTPGKNRGNALLPAQQVFTTFPNRLTNDSGQEKGNEKFWLIWAAQTLPELKEIIKTAFQNGGPVTDAAQQATLRQFTARYRLTPQAATTDTEQSKVTLTGRDDILTHLLELEHRDWK